MKPRLTLYRFALRLLPGTFRDRYGREMEQHLERLLDGTYGPRRAATYTRALIDVALTAPSLRLHAMRAQTPAAARGSDTTETAQMNGSIRRDLSYSLRGLARNPGFASAAILTLALGLGAATTIFSVVNGVLMRPLPYMAPDRVVNIWVDFGVGGQSLPAVSIGDFVDYKTKTTLFQDFAAASGGGMIGATGIVTGGGIGAEKVDVSPVTANFFPLLGVRPALGRMFTKEEEAFRGPRVVMLSYELWERRYGADSSIVGRTIELDGRPETVVGVMPRGFHLQLPAEAFLIKDSQIWKPLQIDYTRLPPRNYTSLTVFGRLKPGVTYAQAQQEMDRIARWLRATYPVHEAAKIRIRAVPLQDDIVKAVRPTLQLLLAAAVLVVLIACANVANLLLTRASGREREFAVRIAMGASRTQIVRQVFTDGLVIATIGGLLGLAMTYAAISYLGHLHPANLPRLDAVRIDWRVLGFVALACVATALMFAAAPAIHGARSSIGMVLKGGARVAGGGRRLRHALITGEIALSLMLLVCAGLLVRSFIALQQVRPGFEANGLVTFRMSLPFAKYRTGPDRRLAYEAIEARLRALPGVTDVGAISQLPLTGSGPLSPYAFDPKTAQNWESVTADGRNVTPSFFTTMGTRLLSGRSFTPQDGVGDGAQQVIIIDEMLAKKAFPDASAVGKQLQVGPDGRPDDFATIIGVVEHTRIHDLGDDVREQLYRPLLAGFGPNFAVAIRTSGDPVQLIASVRRAVAGFDPNLPLSSLVPMTVLVDDALSRARFSLLLMEGLGALALVLALVGVYGVISFSVAQRTREFGVRMALGQSPSGLRRSVVLESFRLIAPSVGLGVLGAAFATRYLEGLLYGVARHDPLTFAIAPVLMLTIALLACYAPAREASRVDPMTALRSE